MARWQWWLNLWVYNGRFGRLHYRTRSWAGSMAGGAWGSTGGMQDVSSKWRSRREDAIETLEAILRWFGFGPGRDDMVVFENMCPWKPFWGGVGPSLSIDSVTAGACFCLDWSPPGLPTGMPRDWNSKDLKRNHLQIPVIIIVICHCQRLVDKILLGDKSKW